MGGSDFQAEKSTITLISEKDSPETSKQKKDIMKRSLGRLF